MINNKCMQILAGGAVAFTLVFISGCESRDKTPVNTNTQQEFLPVEEAFVFSASMKRPDLIKTRWKIAEGYHLYKDKFEFSVAPETYQIVEVDYPQAVMFSDKNLGKLESYNNFVEISIRVSSERDASTVQLTSKYQGCADVGLCYPPETRVSQFDLVLKDE